MACLHMSYPSFTKRDEHHRRFQERSKCAGASNAIGASCDTLFPRTRMHKITTLDDNWMGRPKSIGTALLESDGHSAIVDPGPSSTLDTLKKQLRAHGTSVRDL